MTYDPNENDDWARQVPERRRRGPYEDYGWERGESIIPAFRDPSVHRQPYEDRPRGMEGRRAGGEFREGRVPFEGNVGDEGYRRRGRDWDYGREWGSRSGREAERGRTREYGRVPPGEFDREDWRYDQRGRGRDQSAQWESGDTDYPRERAFGRGAYTPRQSEFDRETNRGTERSYGAQAGRFGDYGATSEYGRSGNYGLDREFGGADASAMEPAGWSYTEIWIIPGPMTGLGPKGYQTSDERIYEQVCERMTQHGDLDASDIEVRAENGEITLEGTVPDRRMKRLAEDLSEKVPGVQDVHNHLRVKNRDDSR